MKSRRFTVSPSILLGHHIKITPQICRDMYILLNQIANYLGGGLPALIRLDRIRYEARDLIKKARGEQVNDLICDPDIPKTCMSDGSAPSDKSDKSVQSVKSILELNHDMFTVLAGICQEKSAHICQYRPESCKVCQINKVLKKARGEQ